MSRPSQEGKLLAAALHCFAAYGYEATRTRQIAERAGMSEGALYRHYESKEALAQALFAYYFGVLANLLEPIVDSARPVEEKLREIIRTALDYYRHEPEAFSFVLLRQPSFMPRLPPGTRYPMDMVEAVVREGQLQGRLRAGQPNLLAAIFMGCLLRPIILSRLADPGALDLLHEPWHDQVIADAAWAALARVA